MDSRSDQDMISCLPDILLALIISYLSYKQAVQMSTLAVRWKDVYRNSTNISFKESEYVNIPTRDRASFVAFMVNWASEFNDGVIERFELCFSKPLGFETEINSLIEFAVSKRIKNLVLDFSDPSWRSNDQAAGEASVFQLPECVYSLETLESLKLFACDFDLSRLSNNTGSFKSLCFGWIQLEMIEILLKTSPLLKSLSFHHCWNIGLDSITRYNNRLRELVFEYCEFATQFTFLDLPNIQVFKYVGRIYYFQFLDVNVGMEEAYLDFQAETQYDQFTATVFCDLLCELSTAKKLTVCPFLIQRIKDSEDPNLLEEKMETRHLVIRTKLVPEDFVGIKRMLNSCPKLETLTFEMIPPSPPVLTHELGFDPETYWTCRPSHECLEKTLKVVEVRNVVTSNYELHVLRFLIRWGLVLENVDLYLPKGAEESHKEMVRGLVSMMRNAFEASSEGLLINQYDG